MKKSYSEQVQQLEKEMDEYATRNGQLLCTLNSTHFLSISLFNSLVVDNDRISREYKSLKDLYERLQQSFNEEQTHIQQQIHTFTEQLHEKIAGYEQEKIKRIEVQDQNSELRMIIDKYRSQVSPLCINCLPCLLCIGVDGEYKIVFIVSRKSARTRTWDIETSNQGITTRSCFQGENLSKEMC